MKRQHPLQSLHRSADDPDGEAGAELDRADVEAGNAGIHAGFERGESIDGSGRHGLAPIAYRR